MKYDVFISYSRKDIETAEKLCKALKQAGISYWIDRNIHGSANFLSEITHYIRGCKVVVFIASSNSAASEWTQKEILFAIKHKKHIVPYRIGDFQFENNDELDFIFTNVQWIESEESVVKSIRLELDTQQLSISDDENCGNIFGHVISIVGFSCRKILRWMSFILALCTLFVICFITFPIPIKSYKVGDYYDDGDKQGVVFYVDDTGKHGKIMSLDRVVKTWDKAVVYCDNLGSEWSLPSQRDLIFINKNFQIINEELLLLNKDVLDWTLYWSSLEDENKINAWVIYMGGGSTAYHNKNKEYNVRAVSAF